MRHIYALLIRLNIVSLSTSVGARNCTVCISYY